MDGSEIENAEMPGVAPNKCLVCKKDFVMEEPGSASAEGEGFIQTICGTCEVAANTPGASVGGTSANPADLEYEDIIDKKYLKQEFLDDTNDAKFHLVNIMNLQKMLVWRVAQCMNNIDEEGYRQLRRVFRIHEDDLPDVKTFLMRRNMDGNQAAVDAGYFCNYNISKQRWINTFFGDASERRRRAAVTALHETEHAEFENQAHELNELPCDMEVEVNRSMNSEDMKYAEICEGLKMYYGMTCPMFESLFEMMVEERIGKGSLTRSEKEFLHMMTSEDKDTSLRCIENMNLQEAIIELKSRVQVHNLDIYEVKKFMTEVNSLQ